MDNEEIEMINVQAIMVSCGLCVGLMMVLIYSNSRNIRMAFYDERLYFRLCYTNLILCVMELIATLIDGKTFAGAIGFNIIFNSLLFLGNYYFTIVWYQFVVYKVKGRVLKTRFKDLVPLAIPIVFGLLSVVNLFTPVIFEIGPDNVYHRLPLATYAFLATYVFLIYTVIYVVANTSKGNRFFLTPVLIFTIPIFVGSAIQLIFYGISLIYITEAFGLTCLYIYMQNEASILDSLTKLYNREYLTRYIKAFTVNNDKTTLLGGLMIDVNRFKEINDRYGHEEGDRALINISNILKSASGEKDLIARYGGDEFVILSEVDMPTDMDPLKERIIEELRNFNSTHDNPYELSISIGSGVMDPYVDSANDFMKLIDSRMYKDKDDYYRNMSINGFY